MEKLTITAEKKDDDQLTVKSEFNCSTDFVVEILTITLSRLGAEPSKYIANEVLKKLQEII